MHKTTPPEELDFLEAADRFLIECLKIYRIKPRLRSMIYREHFLDRINDLEEEAQRVYDASKDLLNAPHFSELLKVIRGDLYPIPIGEILISHLFQLILLLGNFLNASNHKGNARGFKVSSINKLVDTKSSQSSNWTLLHFTAKTVTQTMPEVEDFLRELARPADAFKG